MTTRVTLSNRTARALWLEAHGLAAAPTGPLDVMALIQSLGFLQIDTIRNVTRAHNHILWSRNRAYREGMLWPLLAQRQLFEHFTHDASLIPRARLQDWGRQFRRLGDKVAAADWYQSGLGQDEIARIKARIRDEGALSTKAFQSDGAGREMWARPPHKKALDQMWYAGELATCHRQNFVKFYDLGDRVLGTGWRDAKPEQRQGEALCQAAMDRLGFATCGEVQRFWGVLDAAETQRWQTGAELVPVDVEGADGVLRPAWATPALVDRLSDVPELSGQMRILNPFDPAIRDRARLSRLFGFDYRNEMFVPKAKRLWGYYVYPLLERDRFVGRIELRADRSKGTMNVVGFWPEPGTRWGKDRRRRLMAELTRFAGSVGLRSIAWDGAF